MNYNHFDLYSEFQFTFYCQLSIQHFFKDSINGSFLGHEDSINGSFLGHEDSINGSFLGHEDSINGSFVSGSELVYGLRVVDSILPSIFRQDVGTGLFNRKGLDELALFY